jgi:hypothetical protein
MTHIVAFVKTNIAVTELKITPQNGGGLAQRGE